MLKEEKNWNIFIIRDEDIYKAFTAYGDNGYDNFLDICKAHNWDIVAYESEVSEEEMNKITGYRIKPEAKNRGYILDGEKDIEEIGELYLGDLVDKLNSDDSEFYLIPSHELEKLRESLR